MVDEYDGGIIRWAGTLEESYKSYVISLTAPDGLTGVEIDAQGRLHILEEGMWFCVGEFRFTTTETSPIYLTMQGGIKLVDGNTSGVGSFSFGLSERQFSATTPIHGYTYGMGFFRAGAVLELASQFYIPTQTPAPHPDDPVRNTATRLCELHGVGALSRIPTRPLPAIEG